MALLHLHFDLLIVLPGNRADNRFANTGVTAVKRRKRKTNYSKALFILPHGENDLINFFPSEVNWFGWQNPTSSARHATER